MSEPDEDMDRESFSGDVLVTAIAALAFMLSILALVLAFTVKQ